MISLTSLEKINDIPKPYTYKKVKSGWICSKFVVLYEDTKVYAWSGNEDMLSNIVDIMNTAYMVGAVDEMARNKFGR